MFFNDLTKKEVALDKAKSDTKPAPKTTTTAPNDASGKSGPKA